MTRRTKVKPNWADITQISISVALSDPSDPKHADTAGHFCASTSDGRPCALVAIVVRRAVVADLRVAVAVPLGALVVQRGAVTLHLDALVVQRRAVTLHLDGGPVHRCAVTRGAFPRVVRGTCLADALLDDDARRLVVWRLSPLPLGSRQDLRWGDSIDATP